MKIATICRIVLFAVIAFAAHACSFSRVNNADADEGGLIIAGLRDTLQALADSSRGTMGIALLTDRNDTVVINNSSRYPLMSVFKLHQAMALCHHLDSIGISPDTIVSISRGRLSADTWSPMLKDFHGDVITISVRDLMRYAITQSDNNASNYLFENILPVAATDSFIARLIPRDSFCLEVTEAEMKDNHNLCRENHSSPLGAALLIERLFTDSILTPASSAFLRAALGECRTGSDRIAAPLSGISGITVAHKTGSGFRDADGKLMAHNDVAFITLPGGRHYTLAVLLTDFRGTDKEASEEIAAVSAAVSRALTE